MKLPASRSLLGLLLFTLVSVPALILADDILVTWGTNMIQTGGRQSLFVPARTYITKSEITSVALSSSSGSLYQTLTLVEGDRNVSIWSNEIREDFLYSEELTVGLRGFRESNKIDLSNIASFLPANIKHMEMRPADGLYLNTRGELYRITSGFDLPVRIPSSEFHLAPGWTFVDASFKELKCAGTTCIALGNSGRFYISSQRTSDLFNPSFPDNVHYQNFYELDLHMLDRLDITHWDFTASRFVFVNHSTEIYEVGRFGIGVTLNPTLNMDGSFSTGFPTDINFLCTQYSQTIVITHNLAVHFWTSNSHLPASAIMVEDFLFDQRSQFNNELVQVGGTLDAWLFLMSDGKLFTFSLVEQLLPNRRDASFNFGDSLEHILRNSKHDESFKRDQKSKREIVASGTSYGNQYSIEVLREFVSEVFLGETIPATHQIVSLVASPESLGAGVLVKPRTSADATIAIPKFDDPQDNSGSILISWGRISPMLGTGWGGHSADQAEFAPMEPVLLSHLSRNLRNITKVATGGPVIVALTQDGHVMTWGCTVQLSEACWHAIPMAPISSMHTTEFSDLPSLSVAIPLDRLYIGNQTVVDIAVSQTATALLLEDKSILYWATLAAEMPSKRSNHNNLQEKRQLRGKRAAYTLPPLATRIVFGYFDQVFAGKDTILAIDSTNHTLTAIDIQNNFDQVILSNVEVVHIDVASDLFGAAFVVRNLSSDTLHFLYYGEALGGNCLTGQMWPGAAPFQVCDVTPTIPFSLSTIRQVLVNDGSNSVIVMTDDQIYYAGGPSPYSYDDTNFNYRPLPQTIPVPISSIVKMAMLQERLTILTTTGDLYMTFDGFNIQDMTSSSDVLYGNFTLMKSDYTINSIPTHQRAWQKASFVAFGTKKPDTSMIPPAAPTTDISSFFYGTNYFCQFGLENCAPSQEAAAVETDPYHPVNSPTASQISIGFVASLVDGSVSNGFQITHRGQGRTTHANRVLRWGGPKRSVGGSTRYQQITYQEAPFYEDEQALLTSAAVRMVKTVSIGSSHVTLYSNCTIAVQWYSIDGPTGTEAPLRNTWPNTGVVGPPIAISDDSYGYRALREFYVSNHYPMSQMISYGACGGPGAPLAEDLQCREKDSIGDINTQNVPIHCTIRSGSRLFSVQLAGNSLVNCEDGLLGPYDECVRNTSRLSVNIYGLVEVDTTSSQSAFSGLTIAQYRLGFLHAVALTSDGTVVSWGDNSYSQLGLGGPTDEVPIDPPIPVAVKRGGGATQISSNENAHTFDSTASSKRSSSGISFTLGTPTRTALPPYVTSGRKVFAAGYSSFLLTKDHRIFGWGDNFYGVLGRGIEARDLLHSPVIERVILPFAAIADAECASYSCYALYESGDIFSWGNNAGSLLGRETGVPNSISGALPAEAKKMKFKDPKKKVKEIFVGPGTVLVRGKDEPTPPPACPGEMPTTGNFTCVDGKWTYGADLSITRTQSGTPGLIIQTPVVIIGNLTVPAGESIEIVIDDFSLFNDPEKPYISVSGCFQGGGEIQFKFEPRAWIKFKNEGNGKKLTTVESSCQMQEPGSQIIQQVDAPDTCQKASSKSHGTERPNSKFGLQSTFTINSSRCTRWWMILLCVIAAVIIITAVVAIVYRFKKFKSSQASSQRVRSSSVRSN